MTAKELVEKIEKSRGSYPEQDEYGALGAFLANLAQVFKIALPENLFEGAALRERYLFWCGVIAGYGKEIPAKAVKEAHMAMSFPFTRAIVSGALYGKGLVTNLGVPAEYMK